MGTFFRNQRNFTRFAWLTLGFLILVILWGAFVRATGSGAGCGNHWPLCNGVVVPRAARIETLIEFAHRVSSALSGLMVLALWVWAVSYTHLVGGVLLFLLAVITLLALIDLTNAGWLAWWTRLLRQVFGWGAFAVCLFLAAVGLRVALGRVRRLLSLIHI